MYKQINILKDTNGLYIVSEKLYTFLNDKKILGEFSLDGKLLWSTEPSNIYYRYNVRPKLILYYKERKKQELYILNRESKDLLKIDNINLNITSDNCYWESILVSFVDDKIIKYNLNTYAVVSEEDDIKGCINLTTDNYIITQYNSHIYTYQKSDFSLFWQKDISEIASYTDWDGKHQGNIKNVYLFEDKLIVTAGGSVLALNIENGEMLWQVKYTDFQPLTLHINGKFAYLARGVFYSVIDLEKGEKILETMLIRPFDHDKKYEKANLAMVGSDMTFYDNYLYFSDKHKGQYYLAKLNPQTGKIEDFQFLEGITSNLHPPKFYENKMFLQDNENNLFIYERDKI